MKKVLDSLIYEYVLNLTLEYVELAKADETELQEVQAKYIQDLKFIMGAYGIEVACVIHKRIIAAFQLYTILQRVKIAAVCALQAVALYHSNTNEQMLFSFCLALLMLNQIVKTISSDYLNLYVKIILPAQGTHNSIASKLLLAEIEHLNNRLAQFEASDYNIDPRVIYNLASIHHRLSRLLSNYATANPLIKDTTLAMAESCKHKAEAMFKNLLAEKHALGVVCTFDLSTIEQYLSGANPDLAKAIELRQYLFRCRRNDPTARQIVVLTMATLLNRLDPKVTVDENAKLSPNQLLLKIIAITHDKNTARELEDIISDSIDSDPIFFAATTQAGHTYEFNTINKWFVNGGKIDPISGSKINRNLIANLEYMNVVDYLAFGGKITEYPGFINPETNKPYVQPLLRFSGESIDKPTAGAENVPENIIFRQLIEKFAKPRPLG